MEHSLLLLFAIVFLGSAILGTVALYARQTMILAYILLGMICGPIGLGFFDDDPAVKQLGEAGIIFLLFLLGLNLYPQKLMKMLGEAFGVTLLSAIVFAIVASTVGYILGYRGMELALIAICAVFSSTIIGLKLLPTTTLHHQHAGEVIISVLLLQDLIAILVLVALKTVGGDGWMQVLVPFVGLPLGVLLGFALNRWLVMPLLMKFDTNTEYIFLVVIAWCLGFATLAHAANLSYEIGAFIAGVTLATNPISRYVAEQLKPLRDFFLVVFFFALGASLTADALTQIWWQALLLAGVLLLLKPPVFRVLLERYQEKSRLSAEIGTRLGQMSEFSLLVTALALAQGLISNTAAALITTATIVSMMLSSQWIVMRLPTPGRD